MRATSLSLSAVSGCAAIIAVAAVFAIPALGANRDALRQVVQDQCLANLTNTWSPIEIGGSGYNALRIEADDLDGVNPFELVDERTPSARHFMGDYTLVVAGMQFESGPGFILLAGSGRAGELLLDSTCAIAGA